jgi:uracil-DNA glycosylase
MSFIQNLPIFPEWKEALKPEFEANYFQEIINFLKEEKANGEIIYPPGSKIFEAFNHFNLSDTKVVIIGQDPYHGPKQAHGLCFSVNKGIQKPPSLQNIFKEIQQDLGIDPPPHGDLTDWAKQGVLLLNAILTVRANNAGSHQKIGWETFTDAVIKTISEQTETTVFLLWGRFAHSKETLIDENKHFILKAAHPSPLSAYNGFFGCKHFSQTNEILKSVGKEPINW